MLFWTKDFGWCYLAVAHTQFFLLPWSLRKYDFPSWTLTWLLIGSRKQVISHSDMTCMQHILQDGWMKARTKKGVRLFQTSDSSSNDNLLLSEYHVSLWPFNLLFQTVSTHSERVEVVADCGNFSLHFLALVKVLTTPENTATPVAHSPTCWYCCSLFPFACCLIWSLFNQRRTSYKINQYGHWSSSGIPSPV